MLHGSPADGSLLARRGTPALPEGLSADEGSWAGWEVQASPDGRIYYHHAASATSQWEMPRDLSEVLGEWMEVSESNGSSYWYNGRLGCSSWTDPRQCSSVHQAALDGNLFYLQLYAFADGFSDALDKKGRSALHCACAAGQAEAALLLLQSKASLALEDRSGSTPLHWACRYGHNIAVRLLLEADANPDHANRLGDTPMHEAAALGQVETLQWLILARADPRCRNLESRTPAQFAALRGWNEAEILIASYEAQPCWTIQPLSCGQEDDAQSNRRRHAQRHRPPVHDLGEDGLWSEVGEDSPVSPALKVVRAARPVLRGVQWLANRVLGERHVDLGKNNSFKFDAATGQWVAAKEEEVVSDEASYISDSEDEDEWALEASSQWNRSGSSRAMEALEV